MQILEQTDGHNDTVNEISSLNNGTQRNRIYFWFDSRLGSKKMEYVLETILLQFLCNSNYLLDLLLNQIFL